MSELVSQEELAGQPPLPSVELTPKSPPLQITELYPSPEPPPPPPFNRETALVELQAAFAALSDEELQIARLRMLGVPYADISEELELLDEEVEKLWKRARRKLGTVMFGIATEAVPPAGPINPALPPNTGTPQETEGTSPA